MLAFLLTGGRHWLDGRRADAHGPDGFCRTRTQLRRLLSLCRSTEFARSAVVAQVELLSCLPGVSHFALFYESQSQGLRGQLFPASSCFDMFNELHFLVCLPGVSHFAMFNELHFRVCISQCFPLAMFNELHFMFNERGKRF